MIFDIRKLFVIFCLFCSLFANAAFAGPFSSDAKKCIVSSISQEERASMMKWAFLGMSRHPDLDLGTSPAESEFVEVDLLMAELFMEIVTVRCRDELKIARELEGANVIEKGFEVLGQLAARELFTHPKVY